jgi:transposase
MTAMPGIAQTTAAALIAAMPELGNMDRKQAAALAGLAPHPNESGKKIGYRRMRGGRTAVRTILFMPAMQAACGRGEFAAFYKRLVAAGKKPILALAAVMRKIVVTLNARLRDAQIQQS